MPPVLVTPPTALPVGVDALRHHLRVDHTEDDELIASFAAAAVGYLDGWSGVLGRAILPQTWAEQWNCAGPYALALPDVNTASLVVTADGSTVPSTDVKTEITNAGLKVTLTGRYATPVRIQYECHMPEAALSTVRVIIMMLVGHWYANREAVMATQTVEVPLSVSALMAPLRRVRV